MRNGPWVSPLSVLNVWSSSYDASKVSFYVSAWLFMFLSIILHVRAWRETEEFSFGYLLCSKKNKASLDWRCGCPYLSRKSADGVLYPRSEASSPPLLHASIPHRSWLSLGDQSVLAVFAYWAHITLPSSLGSKHGSESMSNQIYAFICTAHSGVKYANDQHR